MSIYKAKEWFNVYYSQNQEDLILKAFFHDLKQGFYIDIGAHDPEFFNVTKLFYDEGWSGINIEPIKRYHSKLVKSRKRDINLNVALGHEKSQLMFREYPEADGLSTLSKTMKDEYVHNKEYEGVTKKYSEYKVQVLTLKEIFAEHCKDKTVNFLKLDVEGFEEEVIKGNDWKKNRPQVLCIEANHEAQDWHHLLEQANYRKFFWDGLNDYFVAEENYNQLSKGFNFSETALRKIPLANTPLELFTKEFKDLQKDNDLKQKQLEAQDKHIKTQEEAVEYLNKKLEELSKLEIEYNKLLPKAALKVQRRASHYRRRNNNE